MRLIINQHKILPSGFFFVDLNYVKDADSDGNSEFGTLPTIPNPVKDWCGQNREFLEAVDTYDDDSIRKKIRLTLEGHESEQAFKHCIKLKLEKLYSTWKEQHPDLVTMTQSLTYRDTETLSKLGRLVQCSVTGSPSPFFSSDYVFVRLLTEFNPPQLIDWWKQKFPNNYQDLLRDYQTEIPEDYVLDQIILDSFIAANILEPPQKTLEFISDPLLAELKCIIRFFPPKIAPKSIHTIEESYDHWKDSNTGLTSHLSDIIGSCDSSLAPLFGLISSSLDRDQTVYPRGFIPSYIVKRLLSSLPQSILFDWWKNSFPPEYEKAKKSQVTTISSIVSVTLFKVLGAQALLCIHKISCSIQDELPKN